MCVKKQNKKAPKKQVHDISKTKTNCNFFTLFFCCLLFCLVLECDHLVPKAVLFTKHSAGRDASISLLWGHVMLLVLIDPLRPLVLVAHDTVIAARTKTCYRL